ncbi:MAG: glycosyltransferase family 2 protein [Chitinispirillales bacterium]|jgi:glycosyltransferase involved in cell wall biosynthesis|nr:glycosyltransferase family 2 protein [Chitinispirillales bacterium]
MPSVSVVIPTFNRCRLLRRAVESVLNQTERDFELIVVDDGSTDGTAGYLDKLTQARILRFDKNYGVSKARNAGVAVSKGEWVAFLDSDDMWHPDKLRLQLKWCAQNPQYNIAQTNEIWIRNGVRVNPPDNCRKTCGDIFNQSVQRCMITPSSVIMKRALFDLSGGFDEQMRACEDYDMWLRITCRFQVGLEPQNLLTRYGGHDDQLSSSTSCLDKYRIEALAKIIFSGELNKEQAEVAKRSLLKRVDIMANGSMKRGNTKEYEYYAALRREYLNNRTISAL